MTFVDSHSILLGQERYSLLDVRDGSVRPLKQPVYDDAQEAQNETVQRQKANPIYDERWSVGSRGPLFGLRGIAEESFVLALRRNDGMRVSVRSWRTGGESFHRDYPNGDVSIAGNRVYIEWVAPGTGQARLDAWDLTTGEAQPTPAAPEQLDLKRGHISRDGRYVADPAGGSKLRVWSLTEGRMLFTVQADLFAFSSDSRLLAVLLHARPRFRREGALRIYDAATGKIVAERSDTGVALTAEGILAFHDEDRCIAAYSLKRDGKPFPTIDVWQWKEDSLQTLQARSGFQGPVWVTYGPPIAPQFVLDGQHMIDVATGKSVCTLATPKAQVVASTPDWAVVRSSGARLSDRLAAAIRPYSSTLAARIAAGDSADLCDLATGRSAAGLGKGRYAAKFSPDGKWMATHDHNSIEIWRVPPSRPWRRAFTVSLIVPALASFRGWRRRRREGREPALVS